MIMDKFFVSKQPWSELKHDILEEILNNRVFSMGDSHFTYIDGFAGAGEYKDGSKGSPLIALDVFADLLCNRPDNDCFIEIGTMISK